MKTTVPKVAKSAKQAAAHVAERAKKRDYAYTDLDKLKIGSEPINVYGVILDATFPHKSFKSDKYICTYKIADHTCKFTDGIVDYISVVFFARKFEDLPISQSVGEIIRIHRATVGLYKDRLQLTVNICFNSSWALFAPSFQSKKSEKQNEFVPLSFFGRSMHTELADKKLVMQLRGWTATIFLKNQVLSNKYITKLSSVPSVGASKVEGKPGYDFDLQVKILQLFKVDEYQSEMRVIDESGEIWHSSVFNVKYRSIKQGQYVRIRAASLSNHQGYEKTFGMRPYSNILTLPYPCKLAEDMMFDEYSESQGFEQTQLLSTSILMHPIVVSTVVDPKASINECVTLSEITEEEKVFKVRFSVAHSSSSLVAKCVKLREKSGELKNAPASPALLKKGQDLVTCMQFLVKDASMQSSNLFTRVNLIDSGNFFKIDPKDLLMAKNNAVEKLKEKVKILERFNVWIEASVQKKNGQLVITDATNMKSYN